MYTPFKKNTHHVLLTSQSNQVNVVFIWKKKNQILNTVYSFIFHLIMPWIISSNFVMLFHYLSLEWLLVENCKINKEHLDKFANFLFRYPTSSKSNSIYIYHQLIIIERTTQWAEKSGLTLTFERVTSKSIGIIYSLRATPAPSLLLIKWKGS